VVLSNETPSVDKVITWSGPAKRNGGLLPFLQPSQKICFLQEMIITTPVRINDIKRMNTFLIKEVS